MSAGQDLDGIFKGIEQPATGRQLPEDGDVLLTFNSEVSVSQLAKAIHVDGLTGTIAGGTMPSYCASDGSGKFAHHPPVRLVDPLSAWTRSDTSLGAALVYPMGLNVLSFGNFEGVFYTEGAAAARGDIKLGSFSANAAVETQVGLIAGGKINLVQGTVGGDIYVGESSTIEPNTNVLGTITNAKLLRFDEALEALTALSDALAKKSMTGTTTVADWGGISLVGTSQELNVFEIDATALSKTTTLQVTVPAESTVVVNVTGNTTFSVQNAGISLNGLAPSHVLWNAPDARLINIASVGFLGSLLAPRARVDMRNGDFIGTLVAREVTGTGSFHLAPFDAWPYSGMSSSVVVEFDRHLFANCQYALTIDSGVALNDQGACVSGAIEIPFRVSGDISDRFFRETDRFQQNGLGEVQWFRLKPGVKLLPKEAFRRYFDTIRIPDTDSLEETTVGLDKGVVPGTSVRHWAQYHDGLPVRGRGFAVETLRDGGYLRDAIGGLVTPIVNSASPEITSDGAIAELSAALTTQPYPWIASPSNYSVPTAKLLWFPHDDGSVSLAWEINLQDSGIVGVYGGVVDAVSGELISVFRSRKDAIDCNLFKPTEDYSAEDVAMSVETKFNGTQDFLGSRITQGTSYYELRVNDARTRSAGGDDPTPGPVQVVWQDSSEPEYPAPDVAPICSVNDQNDWDTPFEQSAASALWGVEAADKYFQTILFEEETPWAGIAGHIATSEHLSAPMLQLVLRNSGLIGAYDPRPKTSAGKVEGLPLVTPAIYLNVEYSVSSPLYVDFLAHEYSHGVLEAARARLGNGEWCDFPTEGEALALQEGFADLFAELVEGTVDSIADACFTPDCFRNFAEPAESMGLTVVKPIEIVPEPKPSTYGRDPWVMDSKLDEYGHVNSTVLTHWFYLLTHGTSGERLTNGNGCSYRLTKIEPAEVPAAAQTVFTAFTSTLGSMPTYPQLRNATVAKAQDLYGQGYLASKMQAAWQAVGVGSSPLGFEEVGGNTPVHLSPSPGAADVEPWLARFSWETPSDESWLVSLTWTDPVTGEEETSEHTFSPQLEFGDRYQISENVPLHAGVHYEWTAQPLSSTSWEACGFSSDFTTAEKLPVVEVPTKKDDGVYVLDSEWGPVNVKPLSSSPQADVHFVYAIDRDCQALMADVESGEWHNFDESKYVCSTNDSCIAQSDGSLFVANLMSTQMEMFEPGETYSVSVLPFEKGSASQGTCEVVQVKWPDRERPILVKPGVDHEFRNPVDWGSPDEIYVSNELSGSDRPVFEWTPVEGAVAYRINGVWGPCDDRPGRCRLWDEAQELDFKPCSEFLAGTYDSPNNLCYQGPMALPLGDAGGNLIDGAIGKLWWIEAVFEDDYTIRSRRYGYYLALPPIEFLFARADRETSAVNDSIVYYSGDWQYAHYETGGIASFQDQLVGLSGSSSIVSPGITFLVTWNQESENAKTWSRSYSGGGDGYIELTGVKPGRDQRLSVKELPWFASTMPEWNDPHTRYIKESVLEFRSTENLVDVDDDGDGFSEMQGDCYDSGDLGDGSDQYKPGAQEGLCEPDYDCDNEQDVEPYPEDTRCGVDEDCDNELTECVDATSEGLYFDQYLDCVSDYGEECAVEASYNYIHAWVAIDPIHEDGTLYVNGEIVSTGVCEKDGQTYDAGLLTNEYNENVDLTKVSEDVYAGETDFWTVTVTVDEANTVVNVWFYDTVYYGYADTGERYLICASNDGTPGYEVEWARWYEVE